MTAEELKTTGISTLSPQQRIALDLWLSRYTAIFWKELTAFSRAYERLRKEQSSPSSSLSRYGSVASNCTPAIESTISGTFNGWDGETIFKLDNGQTWQQAEYDYTYTYSYRPDVTIYSVVGGCRLKVEDEDDTILVKRLK